MDIKLPNLGEGADSGIVVNLLVKEGDQLTKDQPILELENEKAVASIPSPAAGTVSKLFIKTGDRITVGQRILALAGGGDSAAPSAAGSSPATTKNEPAPPAKAAPAQSAQPAAEPPTEPAEETDDAPPAPAGKPGLAPPASPSIRKLAWDLGIDLSRVRGSERGGRIVLGDVRAYIQKLQSLAERPKTSAPAPTAPEPARPVAEQIDFSKWGTVSKQPVSPLRQVIARRMSENWRAVPRVTQFDEADITDMMALLKKYGPQYEQRQARLTLTALALKAVVDTLKRHPILNSSLDEAAQEIVFKNYYHIGVAVDTEAGLIVPVLRDVDQKSLLAISKELAELAAKARDRKVSSEELKGGTFTISNQGGIGGGHFTPIVNKPEVAILGLGRGTLKAVVRGEAILPRRMLPMALAYDHRVIDGGTAARFTVDLVKALQSFPESILSEGLL